MYINNYEKTSLESAPFQYNVIVFQQDPKIHVLFYMDRKNKITLSLKVLTLERKAQRNRENNLCIEYSE